MKKDNIIHELEDRINELEEELRESYITIDKISKALQLFNITVVESLNEKI